MAPAEDVIEEEDDSRFIEDDDDSGLSRPWAVDMPAVFLDVDWELVGDIAGGSEHPVEISLSNDFTLMAWVRGADAERRIMSVEGPNGWMLAAGSNVRFATGSALVPSEEAPDAEKPEEELTAPSQVVGETSLDGEWHHVLVVFKASGTSEIYVDGQLDGEDTVEVPEESMDTSSIVVLGEASEDSHIKDLKVFRTALTKWQVEGLFNNSKELGTGLTLSLLPEQVEEYWKLKADGEEGWRELLQVVAADPFERPFQEEVLMELFEDLMAYAKTICLTSRKTSVIVQIVKDLLDMMHRKSETSRRFGETSSIFECFQEFKRMLVAHSHAAFATAQTLPEKGEISMARLGVFRTSDLRLLTEFITGALFQQFLLYQCVLICPQDSVTTYTEVELLEPLKPPALKKAVSKKMAAKAKAGSAKKSPYAARSKEATVDVPSEEAGPAETEGGFDQTLLQLPKDLSIDEHHEEATKAAEATATTSIRRHDKDLTKAS